MSISIPKFKLEDCDYSIPLFTFLFTEESSAIFMKPTNYHNLYLS